MQQANLIIASIALWKACSLAREMSVARILGQNVAVLLSVETKVAGKRLSTNMAPKISSWFYNFIGI